jgi:hypothetical protein
MKQKIIDLVPDESGVYVPKSKIAQRTKQRPNTIVRHEMQDNKVEAFLNGIDLGLSFFERLSSRLFRVESLVKKK